MPPEENAEVELAAPAIETADEPTNDNAPAPELASEPAIAAEPAEEFDTIDLDGKQYQVPKALKPNFMLHADYTQKTQATAATAKELAAKEQRLVEQFKASEEELGHRATLRNIDTQLEQYSQYTEQQWAQLKAEDPQGWNEHRFHLQALKEARQEAQGKISEAEGKRTQEAQSAATKRIEETQAHAMKIKGWSPEMDKQIVDYAVAKGFTPQQVGDLMTPAMYDMIRYAKIGEESEKRAKNPSLPTPSADPLTVVGGKKNPPGAVDLATADMETFVAARRKQIEAKAKR